MRLRFSSRERCRNICSSVLNSASFTRSRNALSSFSFAVIILPLIIIGILVFSFSRAICIFYAPTRVKSVPGDVIILPNTRLLFSILSVCRLYLLRLPALPLLPNTMQYRLSPLYRPVQKAVLLYLFPLCNNGIIR